MIFLEFFKINEIELSFNFILRHINESISIHSIKIPIGIYLL